MQIGAYTLDLYCDCNCIPVWKRDEVGDLTSICHEHNYNEFPHQYVGDTHRDTSKRAKLAGWKLSKKLDLCPKCNRK